MKTSTETRATKNRTKVEDPTLTQKKREGLRVDEWSLTSNPCKMVLYVLLLGQLELGVGPVEDDFLSSSSDLSHPPMGLVELQLTYISKTCFQKS